jgi:hypothetical protein
MTSPKNAKIIFPFDTRYKMPDSAAPNTAPVSASGGMPINAMRISPIANAHRNAYHGPNKTAQVTLIKCAIGHIPSIRSNGEITTPTATIIAQNIILVNFVFCFIFCSVSVNLLLQFLLWLKPLLPIIAYFWALPCFFLGFMLK